MIRILLILFALALAPPAAAQPVQDMMEETVEEERSLFLGFVEDRLSAPNRQIRISGIRGVLSSSASIGEITVADREGVWLRIVEARIVWSRRALLFGRLEIETLGAELIEVTRRPVPEEGVLPSPEARPFQLPELPLAIVLENLDIERAVFGPQVFGLASELSATGRLRLDGGSLDTALHLTRLDGPGGSLELEATYANDTEVLGIDLSLSEPANGVVANVLGIEGRPPVDLVASGEGPLGDFELSLELDADGERVLTGAARLDRTGEGLGFTAALEGPISRLVAPAYREFFGAETRLTLTGTAKEEGGFRIGTFDLQSGALTATGQAETTADNFLQRLTLDARLAEQIDGAVVLPVPGGDTTVEAGRLQIAYGDTGSDEWSGELSLSGLASGAFAARDVTLSMGGLALDIADPERRRLTFAVDGEVAGIEAEDEDIAEALGDSIALALSGEWRAGEPVNLERATLTGRALALTAQGEISGYVFDGAVTVSTSSIAPFSGLAGRELSGAMELRAEGGIDPLSGGFDLVLDGTATGLGIDNETADRLLAGTSTLSGRVARGEEGLTTEGFRIANPQVELTADGTFATGAADFGFVMTLEDLALLTSEASGQVSATGRAAGEDGTIALNFDASMPAGSLAGRRLTQGTLGFQGTLQEGNVQGTVSGDAFLDGVRAALSSDVALMADGERRLTGLNFTAGGAALTGDVIQNTEGLFDGGLSLRAADISVAAALLLVEASGAATADIALSAQDGRQDAEIEARISNFAMDGIRIGAADIAASVTDLFGVPVADGRATASGVLAGGVEVSRLNAQAQSTGQRTDFSADAALANGTAIQAAGALEPEGDGFRLSLSRAELAQGQLAARLTEPASLLVAGDAVAIDRLSLDVGGGSVRVSGGVAENFDLDVAIAALPLSLANAVRPDLELGGTVDGTARVTGPRDEPRAEFDLRGRGIAAAALRAAGLSPLSVDARGTTTAQTLQIEASVGDGAGFSARASGGVPLGEGNLSLDVVLQSFPLATLNRLAPGQNLSGNITGQARIGGTLADPRADFTLSGSGISAAPLADLGIASLQASASGSYADGAVTLTTANVQGPLGLALSASGRIPLSGPGLQVSASGSVPLALANRALVERGTQLSGTLAFNATASGSLADPSFGGSVSVSGASAVDPTTNVQLNNIVLAASLSGQTVNISQLSASVAGGGTVSGGGTISIDAGAGFPAALRIALDQARYADRNLVVATVSGALAVNGPLTRDPVISGALTIDRAEISLAGSFGGGAALIDVIHRSPPPAVARTLRYARAQDGTRMPSARPSVVRLDISISAPNRIFVRGRGVDAELGGQLRVTGPLTDIQPVGAFNLIRGRLSILGQRITFDEGTVTLIGDMDPFVDFIARSEGSDITVFITVRGRVSDPEISFSAQPELPQDEVLARLIFNRGLHELSAFQIAQLAAAAAELAGGAGGGGLLGGLRDAAGLDDLDIVTDSEGGTAVRAGRYIQDNVYLGVETGSSGTTRGTINLDITEGLRARGALGTDGSTGLGIFYERDY